MKSNEPTRMTNLPQHGEISENHKEREVERPKKRGGQRREEERGMTDWGLGVQLQKLETILKHGYFFV